MKKLRLDPEHLSVESFAAGDAPAPAGTVEAREDATYTCNPQTTRCGVCFCTEQCV
jgi:hypothetical protein